MSLGVLAVGFFMMLPMVIGGLTFYASQKEIEKDEV
jgi:hypothetical protein